MLSCLEENFDLDRQGFFAKHFAHPLGWFNVFLMKAQKCLCHNDLTVFLGITYLNLHNRILYINPAKKTIKGRSPMPQKGPGKYFREGLSLIDLMAMFPDEQAAEAWFEQQRWGPTGTPTACPKCNSKGRLKKTPGARVHPGTVATAVPISVYGPVPSCPIQPFLFRNGSWPSICGPPRSRVCPACAFTAS